MSGILLRLEKELDQAEAAIGEWPLQCARYSKDLYLHLGVVAPVAAFTFSFISHLCALG